MKPFLGKREFFCQWFRGWHFLIDYIKNIFIGINFNGCLCNIFSFLFCLYRASLSKWRNVCCFIKWLTALKLVRFVAAMILSEEKEFLLIAVADCCSIAPYESAHLQCVLFSAKWAMCLTCSSWLPFFLFGLSE